MTTIDTEKLALGWGKIAEGAMEISLAYSAIDTSAAQAGADTGATGAKVAPPLPSVAPAYEANPFDEEPGLKPQVDAGLSICPVHGKPWTIKAAGVSRAGKPFEAFYKCSEKDGDTWCTQKPQKIWRDTHPIPGQAAA